MAAIRPEEGTNLRNSHPNQVIAVCGRTGETTNADDYQYIAGVDVSTAQNLPNGMVVRVVPARRYAVFAHRGPLDTLPDTFKYIYEVWLPQPGHQFADWPELEVYGEAFRDDSSESEMTRWVPIRSAAAYRFCSISRNMSDRPARH